MRVWNVREPWEWSEADVLELIHNQVRESHSLDYKRSASLENTDKRKDEISKDVSAFANSAGGVLAYGVEENGHVPVQIDGGIDPAVITKEWLDQVIHSRISRRVPGVRINPIPLTTTNPGRMVYVVSIPQSHQAPHMAADN